jgi:hypothetical protein
VAMPATNLDLMNTATLLVPRGLLT